MITRNKTKRRKRKREGKIYIIKIKGNLNEIKLEQKGGNLIHLWELNYFILCSFFSPDVFVYTWEFGQGKKCLDSQHLSRLKTNYFVTMIKISAFCRLEMQEVIRVNINGRCTFSNNFKWILRLIFKFPTFVFTRSLQRGRIRERRHKLVAMGGTISAMPIKMNPSILPPDMVTALSFGAVEDADCILARALPKRIFCVWH